MGQVRTTFTSEDKDVQAALDRMTKSLQKYAEENRKLKDQSREGKDQAKGQFDAIAEGLTTTAAKYAPLIGLAVSLNKELERTVDLNRQAAAAAGKLATPQANLLLNLGALPKGTKEGIRGEVSRIATDFGLSEDDVTQRLTSSVSGTGAEDYKRALRAVEISARMTRDPAQGQALARAVGGVQSATKSTATAAGGFLQRVQSMSPVASMEEVAVNLPPAMEALMAGGFNPAQAGALWSKTASAMGDIHGAEATTSVISLFDQLQKAAPTKTPAQTFADLLANPARAKAFVQKASLPAKAAAGFRNLLTGGERLKEFRNAEARLGAPGADTELLRSIADNMELGVQPIAHVGGHLERAIEEGFLGNATGAMSATIRDRLGKALDQAHVAHGFLGFETVLGFPFGEHGERMRAFDIQVGRGVPATRAASSVLEGQLRDPFLLKQNAEPIEKMLDQLRRQTEFLDRIQSNQRSAPDPERHME